MRYIILFTLILSISLAGCKNTDPKDQSPPEVQPSPETVVNEEAAPAGEWLVNYEQALAEARTKQLPVLINFSGSDWCSWCIKLADEVFNKPEFQNYAKDNLVLLNLDFPRKTQLPAAQAKVNEEIAQRYKITGFPTVILLNSEGVKIGQSGYQPGGPQKYIDHLKQMLQQSN